MDSGWGLFIAFVAGVIWQFLTKWTPNKNWLVSFGVAFCMPPALTVGLLGGVWICSVLSIGQANFKTDANNNFQVGWKEIVVFSIWVFFAFLLTLVFLFKLKMAGHWEIGQCQAFAWMFLLGLELCLFRIIARLIPGWLRVGVGIRMGFLNFLFLLYWLYPYGWILTGLTLITLVVAFPMLLCGLAFDKDNADIVMRRRSK
jgi:hypothetical protein